MKYWEPVNDNPEPHQPMPVWFYVLIVVALIYAVVSCFFWGKDDMEVKIAQLKQPIQYSEVAEEASIWERTQ